MSTPERCETLPRLIRVALIGNPNTGKSTLFNALAGMRVQTGNYPGVTVEKKLGYVTWQGQAVELIDLPGTYSLSPRSPDEMVAVELLTGCGAESRPDVVVCICNATALERNLFLLLQVREVGLPTVLCLNMWDAAQKTGIRIDAAALSSRLALPVVTTSALHLQGLEGLKRTILAEASGGRISRPPSEIPEFSPLVVTEIEPLRQWLAAHGVPEHRRSRFLVARSLLDPQGLIENMLTESGGISYRDQLEVARQRLVGASGEVPVIESVERYIQISKLLDGVVLPGHRPGRTLTDRLDSVLTHRVFGFLICLAAMLWVFSTIYWFSEPLSQVVESGVAGMAGLVTVTMSPGPFRSLLVDGVIGGVGAVLIFLPQIAILFLFIALLEDSGYMARAAFMMDRLMAVAGLSGRSFLPLMASFACAVPGILATRVIEDRRDRFVTILIAPLMSCSARLPVYILMTGMFISPDAAVAGGWIPLRGLILTALSLLGLFVAVPVAFLLRRTLFRGEPSAFLLELPEYRVPSVRVMFHRVWGSSAAFVRQAGTLIFATSVLVWAAGSFPGALSRRYELMAEIEARPQHNAQAADPEDLVRLSDELNRVNAGILQQSILGRAGRVIEPLVRPLGWDWRIGIGVVASFPAREVIVATLGTIFSLGGGVDESDEGLRGALLAAQNPDGTKVFTLPVALSILVFFALCAQCVSTLAVIRRETQSWVWPAFSFAYMTILAWIGAFLTYQIGVRI